MTDIFQEGNFEKLLVANWTRFLDSSKLMAYVLNNVQKNANSLAIINGQTTKAKGVKITISRFYLDREQFTIWLEFTAPLGINKMAEGTMELALDFRGNLTHINTTGNIFMP